MPTLPAYLINNVIGETTSGPFRFNAGTKISDTGTLALVQANGGQVFPITDPIVAAAVAILPKYKARGANEFEIAGMIGAAAAASAGATLKLGYGPSAVNSTAAKALLPMPVGQVGTILAAAITFAVAAATGESVVFQVRKNGTNITGATITYNSSSTALSPITIPNMKGVTYVATDYFDANVTYTAGSTPAISGEFAFPTVAVVGQL